MLQVLFTIIYVSLEACTGFRWGNVKERDHWVDPGVEGRIVLSWVFSEMWGYELD
jgi:hypothetical protein